MPDATRLGHYELNGLLGQGAMGQVYRARDTRLGRDVALKVLPPDLARDADRLARFQREAQTLAALDCPGIVTIYSVEEDPTTGVRFLTMQLVEGRSLDHALPEGGLSLPRFLDVAASLAEALAAAHEKGIVHRDLKPANVMLTTEDRVKVLDFGIAKAIQPTNPADATRTSDPGTEIGVVMGTPAYMSPEQIDGQIVHASSDVFSLGIVLYELATGRRPFHGTSKAIVMSSTLKDTPAPPRRADWPRPAAKRLEALILRCLEKSAAARPTAAAVGAELRAIQTLDGASRRAGWLRPTTLVPVAIVAAIAGYAAWAGVSRSRRAVFVAESLPRIEALARGGNYLAAFELARDVEQRGTMGAVSDALWDLASTRVSVVSTPAGATVTMMPFGQTGNSVALGTTPLERTRVPRGPFHWRVASDGYLPADFVSGSPPESLRFELRPANDPDREMVRVPGGPIRLWALGGVRALDSVTLQPFLIDRREVTNREFAAFVAGRGYTRPELWRAPFVEGARRLSFEEAMSRFKDSTGRPGPATWRLGTFPDGEDDLPVTGLSWFEAAAYAAFVGKELPTVYHWYQADTANDIQLLPGLVLSTTNHDGKGPRRATATSTISAYGAVDMAGNVREWAANESDGSTRVALGGAWTDPGYIYLFPDPRSPFDRAPGNGVRTMRRLDAAAGVENTPLSRRPAIDYSSAKPATDAEYTIFTRFYERRPVPFDARIEATDEASPHWVKQRISFAAGYGQERAAALLYLPRDAKPPYQAVVFMGGAGTFYRRSSATDADIFGLMYVDFLVRGGRAVIVPVWKGSYERSDGFHPLQTPWPSYRDHVIQWVSELHQAIDYLQSRDDIADDKIGYQGVSNGAIWAPLFMALEPRLRTGILIVGGLLTVPLHDTPMPPEIDAVNFAPRVTAPVLMLNSRHDAIFPYETSQLPLFNLLGSPRGDKDLKVFPGGHSTFGWTNELIKEALDWLDRRFGPVSR